MLCDSLRIVSSFSDTIARSNCAACNYATLARTRQALHCAFNVSVLLLWNRKESVCFIGSSVVTLQNIATYMAH